MNRLLFLFTLCLAPLFVKAQFDSTKVPFVAYWWAGDSYDFKITKSTKQWRDGEMEKDEKEEYIANFEVLDSTATSYKVKWTYENAMIKSLDIPQDLLEKFAEYELTEVIYQTSELGEFQEVLNWKEISEVMASMIDDVVESIAKDDPKMKEVLVSSMQPLKAVYSSKEGIESIILKELQYFHFPMGVEFDVNEKIEYQDQLPNMFGGDPILANASLYIESVDHEYEFCVLVHDMVLDPEGTRQLIKDFAATMSLPQKELQEVFNTGVFEIVDHNRFEYYYYPGIPHNIEVLRKTNIEIEDTKVRKEEFTQIELIYEEE